ncbi:MAG TPA: hypothetical protein VGG66_01445 [Rhizomicrobium sp.]|jgi:hypothetical protein
MLLHDLHIRFWSEILERPNGPLALRFVLQPMTAGILAMRDGWRDAEAHRPPYLWTMVHNPQARAPLLREGLKAVMRVLLVGAAMDLIYQVVRLHGFRPVETVVIALALGFVPYLIMRGPAARVGRRIVARRERQTLQTGMRPPASTNRPRER